MRVTSPKRSKARRDGSKIKITLVGVFLFAFALVVIWKMFCVMVLSHDKYDALASDQYDLFLSLNPERGDIFLGSASKAGEYFPAAVNREYARVYAKPYLIVDPEAAMEALLEVLPELEEEREALLAKLAKEGDPYEPVLHKVSPEKVAALEAAAIEGIEWLPETFRYYPERNVGSHVLGFASFDGATQEGKYGIEGFFEEELSGQGGFTQSERDARGGLISFADSVHEEPEDGADIYLTIDHSIEYYACNALNEAAMRHGASGGTVIVMEPATGKILAMCSFPDFDPNSYADVGNISVFNNPAIFSAYEPGSVFKPVTMAAALDQGTVTPETTFMDPGSRRIDDFTIRNSDHKTYGRASMTEVLRESINTGVIYAAETIGRHEFARYVRAFGFGQASGIELLGESPGDIASVDRSSAIYMATASFGQGLTVTPLQMVSAYAAIANSGKLMKPYVVEKVEFSDGEVLSAAPKELRQAVSSRAATLLSGMLVSVVQDGHATSAGVPGYHVAGKTGTAQVPDSEKGGYSDATIHTFVGFAPVADPKFAMLVRLDDPKDVQYSASSAAPLFGQIAKFLLNYLEVEPDYDL